MMRGLGDIAAIMRAYGIKSLSLELDPHALEPSEQFDFPEAQAPTEPLKPKACAVAGCTRERAEVFGVSTGFCAEHALTAGAGVTP